MTHVARKATEKFVCSSSSTRQLECVFQDMEPPKYSSILRKSSNILKPIRFVPFTKAVLRHATIRRPKSLAWNDLLQVNLIDTGLRLDGLLALELLDLIVSQISGYEQATC